MSRKLKYLDEAILACNSSPAKKQCLFAERAIYFGRKGEIERAFSELAALDGFSSNTDLSVSVMRNLAYGVIDFYCSNGAMAIDKTLRAYALANAGGLLLEKSLSAAWLSHFFDSNHNVVQACKFAKEALEIAPAEFHDARSRAGLVVAQNLGIAGRPDLAAPWYSSVLRHANSSGDELTISALIFNQTMERVSRWRQSRLNSQDEKSQRTVEFAAASSAGDFDTLVGNRGLENLNPLLIAQVLSLRRCYQLALDIYEENLPRGDYALRMQADFIADQSLCTFYVGRSREAREMMETALAKLVPETHPDDRAATYSRASILYRELGDSDTSVQYGAIASVLWRDYSKLQRQMITLFSEISHIG